MSTGQSQRDQDLRWPYTPADGDWPQDGNQGQPGPPAAAGREAAPAQPAWGGAEPGQEEGWASGPGARPGSDDDEDYEWIRYLGGGRSAQAKPSAAAAPVRARAPRRGRPARKKAERDGPRPGRPEPPAAAPQRPVPPPRTRRPESPAAAPWRPEPPVSGPQLAGPSQHVADPGYGQPAYADPAAGLPGYVGPGQGRARVRDQGELQRHEQDLRGRQQRERQQREQQAREEDLRELQQRERQQQEWQQRAQQQRAQQAREQDLRERQQRELERREQEARDQAQRVQAARAQQAREHAARERQRQQQKRQQQKRQQRQRQQQKQRKPRKPGPSRPASGAAASAPVQSPQRVRPSRRSQRALIRRMLGAAAGVLLIVAGVTVVKYLTRPSPGPAHALVTPARLGTYARNRALAGAMDAEALRKRIVQQSSGEARNVVDAVYEGPAGSSAKAGPPIILFIGGNLAGAAPGAFISSFTGSLKGAVTIGPGSLGGAAACVPSVQGRLAECAWADNDTFGVIASPNLSEAALASELRQMRPLVEHPTK
jgi:hypothetical protein